MSTATPKFNPVPRKPVQNTKEPENPSASTSRSLKSQSSPNATTQALGAHSVRTSTIRQATASKNPEIGTKKNKSSHNSAPMLHNEKLNPSTIDKSFAALLKKAGVNPLSIKDDLDKIYQLDQFIKAANGRLQHELDITTKVIEQDLEAKDDYQTTLANTKVAHSAKVFISKDKSTDNPMVRLAILNRFWKLNSAADVSKALVNIINTFATITEHILAVPELEIVNLQKSAEAIAKKCKLFTLDRKGMEAATLEANEMGYAPLALTFYRAEKEVKRNAKLHAGLN